MDAKTIADATLQGWREKVGNEVGRRAPLDDDVVRAAVGVIFLALSAFYVAKALAELARR